MLSTLHEHSGLLFIDGPSSHLERRDGSPARIELRSIQHLDDPGESLLLPTGNGPSVIPSVVHWMKQIHYRTFQSLLQWAQEAPLQIRERRSERWAGSIN